MSCRVFSDCSWIAPKAQISVMVMFVSCFGSWTAAARTPTHEMGNRRRARVSQRKRLQHASAKELHERCSKSLYMSARSDAGSPGDCQSGPGGEVHDGCFKFHVHMLWCSLTRWLSRWSWRGAAPKRRAFLCSLGRVLRCRTNSVDVAAVSMYFSAGLVAHGFELCSVGGFEMKAQKGHESCNISRCARARSSARGRDEMKE